MHYKYCIIVSYDYGCCYFKWQDVGIVTLVLKKLTGGKTKLNGLESQLFWRFGADLELIP